MAEVYETTEEIEMNLANRIKAAIYILEEIKREESGEHLDFSGEDSYLFPYPAIDWKSVKLLGHSGDYSHSTSAVKSWKPFIQFTTAQNGSVELHDYKRYTSLVLISPDEAPQSFKEYFSYARENEVVPVLIILFEIEKMRIKQNDVYYAVDCPGVLAFYVPPDSAGEQVGKSECTKITSALSKGDVRVKNHGINKIKFESPKTTKFSEYSEVSAAFTASILINTQEDRYWDTRY